MSYFLALPSSKAVRGLLIELELRSGNFNISLIFWLQLGLDLF